LRDAGRNEVESEERGACAERREEHALHKYLYIYLCVCVYNSMCAGM